MNNLEYIEDYFKSSRDDATKKAFEKKIMEDASFAEEVAFYISVNGIMQEQLQEQKRKRFKEIYDQAKIISMKPHTRSIWKYMVAASSIIAILIITWIFTGNRNATKQLADDYIQKNFTTIPVTMGNPDSLQKGLQLFNDNKLAESLAIFESLTSNATVGDEAKKYAGIVSLRLKDYDKALNYFSMLAKDTSLYSNPGKFYKALTLLERNKSGDKESVKVLLKQVRDENLEGKNEAIDWLKKLK